MFGGLEIPVFQVLAWDDDEGENGELTFEIRSLKDETTIFSINNKTGMVYATQSLKFGDMHHFAVRIPTKHDNKLSRFENDCAVILL